VAVDSSDFSSLINLATVYAGLDSSAAALPYYARAFALQPDQLRSDAGVVSEYSMTYADAGFADSARLVLDNLMSGDQGQRAMRLRSLGILDVRRGLGDSALVRFRAAAALSREVGNPTTLIRNLLYVARTLVWLDRVPEARAELAGVAPLLRPASIDPAWIGIAVEVAAAAGDRSLASSWSAAMVKRADMANAVDRHVVYRAQANEALLRGDTQRAVFTAESAVAAQSNPQALETLGRAYERAGRVADAREHYAECLRSRMGGNESVFASLSCMGRSAQLALASGDTVAARQTAKALLSYWPIAEGAFPLRTRVVAILALGPK
jgi:tetratricopeptide (TPR) repeat protein